MMDNDNPVSCSAAQFRGAWEFLLIACACVPSCGVSHIALGVAAAASTSFR